MTIEIGISTRDRPQYLLALLVSLHTQTYQDFDITIVDQNVATPRVEQELALQSMISLLRHTDHTVRVMEENPKGAAYGHNQVLYNTRHKLILRVDDDIILDSDFVQRVYATLTTYREDETVGAVGGVYLNPSVPMHDQTYDSDTKENLIQNGMTIRDDTGGCQTHYHLDDRIMSVTDLYSTFLYRTEIMRIAGGFDESFGSACYFEDTDGSYKIYMQGYSLFVDPQAIGYHFKAQYGGT